MRRRAKRGGFLLGVIAGVAAGVAGVTLLLRQPEDDIAVVARNGEGTAAPGGPPRAAPQRGAPAARGQLRSLLDLLQRRWDRALAEGREAAAARRAELERKLAADRRQAHTVDLVAVSHIDEVSERMAELSGEKDAEESRTDDR